ncbi:hypothetical protein DLAC_00503 [Tieghemostelium lacteum]|uniref:P/Homo B domain-containing protein n=1 Tax=Tieghemostelium lacteum TaxID=361077 RepID=A0A152AA55_TIELA|nr:hypothetical protein DLAC_00503 [Tieghemostelium lacteum]|eukprot:KYR03015.1 hypothetical protein DLAC_00503 [Tieghemostelium lacteum]
MNCNNIFISCLFIVFLISYVYNLDIDSLTDEEKTELANLKINTDHYIVQSDDPTVDIQKILENTQGLRYLESISDEHHLVEIPPHLIDNLNLNNDSVKVVERQFQRYRFHRDIMLWSLPDDPLFPQQWHLHEKTFPFDQMSRDESIDTPIDINVLPLYSQGLTGSGVIVAVVDDGLQWNHTEIIDAYFPEGSWDFNGNDSDPFGSYRDYHGTSVAGVVAARDNRMCGVGVSYRAMISGIRLLSGPTTDIMEAKALSYRNDLNAIYSSSWGPNDDAMRLDGPGFLTRWAISKSIKYGRGGLGSVYVWAGGNGGKNGDNCNYDGYANSRFVITVAACDFQGKHTYYSEPCAALHVTAPSSGGNHSIITSGATHKYLDGCNMGFGGTSATAPQVSGVVALLLQANPLLTWRDIQHILILSTRINDPLDSDWIQNGAGHWVNHKYGYGLVDAQAAFNLTQNWKTLNEYIQIPIRINYVNQPLLPGQTIKSTLDIPEDIVIEHVEIVFTAMHPIRGKLSVSLESPSKTNSILAEQHRDPNPNYDNWKFTTMRCLGESSKGIWTLTVTDNQYLTSTQNGTLNYWKLLIYGHNQ